MIGKAAPPAAPAPGFQVFWSILGRLAAEFMNNRGFGTIALQIEDGKVKRVHINQSFTPEQLPRI
jgi:hypothetical protein